MAVDWSRYDRSILAKEKQGWNPSQIAQYLTDATGEEFTRHQVRHALERAHERYVSLDARPRATPTPYLDKYADYLSGDKPPEPKTLGLLDAVLAMPEAKALVEADHHIPFMDEELFVKAADAHLDSDIVLCAADFMDMYSMSKFPKRKSISFEQEVDAGLRVLEFLSENYPVIKILSANHEHRLSRYMIESLPPALLFLCDMDILEVMARPFPNVITTSDIWFFQFGSGIFAHPEKAGRVELKTPVLTYEHLMEWDAHYREHGFITRDWNMVFTAHTHMGGSVYPSRAKLIEIPPMCQNMSYAYTPKLSYKHPQHGGFVVGTMHCGEFDWNKTREYVKE